MEGPHPGREASSILALLIAFAGGLVSFFSPCTWPLYPAYLGQISVGGRRPLAAAGLFATGFTAVFLGLGASATAVGHWLSAYHLPLRQVSGLLILVLGLAMAGLLPQRLLGQPRHVATHPSARPWGALAMGAAFGFGWTPCIGPVLASILLLAGHAASLGRGAFLLLAFAAGLAGPFLLLAALLGHGFRPRIGAALPLVSRAGGLVLAALGVLVLTGGLSALATYLYGRF